MLLMAAMVSHCFASGMLLAVSQELSSKIAATVFFALIAHKGYEALTFSLLLGERVRRTSWFLACVGAYALSLPLGVVVVKLGTSVLDAKRSPATVNMLAMVISSVAVGSLMGCMIHDFLIPSIQHVRRRKREALWLVVGGALTFLFTVAS